MDILHSSIIFSSPLSVPIQVHSYSTFNQSSQEQYKPSVRMSIKQLCDARTDARTDACTDVRTS
jgi:hypothetical protein